MNKREWLKRIAAFGAAGASGIISEALAKGDLPPGVAKLEGSLTVNGRDAALGTPVRLGDKVATARGTTVARDVIVATNGYTGALTPWLQRRVIPIGSYIIATDLLPESAIAKLIPRDRIVSDTRKVVFYYRTSPDKRRILFGGRVSLDETDPKVSGPLLHADLVRIFPGLRDVPISHSWCGIVAYTFDETMHVGRHDGAHYACGYCGSGVGMASYLGMRVGQQVLGLREGRTAFDDLAFPTRPFYTGRPWFLAPSIRYFRIRDRMPF